MMYWGNIESLYEFVYFYPNVKRSRYLLSITPFHPLQQILFEKFCRWNTKRSTRINNGYSFNKAVEQTTSRTRSRDQGKESALVGYPHPHKQLLFREYLLLYDQWGRWGNRSIWNNRNNLLITVSLKSLNRTERFHHSSVPFWTW